MAISSPRDLWAWFLWSYLEKYPGLRNWILYARGKAYPIFLDYPVSPIPRYGYEKPPHRLLADIIGRGRARYESELASLAKYRDHFACIRAEETSPGGDGEPAWINATIPPLDSMSIYAILASRNPMRYFEIGSGNSTKFARRAVRDHGLRTGITSIDPCPRAEVEAQVDRAIRKPIEEIDLALFHELESGDVLFVDNSHRAFMNSDVTVVFLDILPQLKSGVVVGFHDINLPWDYPTEVAGRYYSEQYLLAVHLLAGGPSTEILLPCFFLSHDEALSRVLELVWPALPVHPPRTHGSAFWLIVK